MSDTSFCLSCDKKPECKEICPELEKILPKPRSGGHRKEFPCDPQKIEGLANKRAFELRYGKKRGVKIAED